MTVKLRTLCPRYASSTLRLMTVKLRTLCPRYASTTLRLMTVKLRTLSPRYASTTCVCKSKSENRNSYFNYLSTKNEMIITNAN